MFEQKSLTASPANRGLLSTVASRQGQAIVRLAKERNWPFQVLGIAPVPTQTVVCRNWRIVPIADEQGEIPARALQRVRAIYEAGIRPKTFVIAHELAGQLPAMVTPPLTQRIEPYVRQALQFSMKAARVTGHVLATYVLPAAGEVLAIAVPIVIAAIVAGLAYDPCLIVVTEDDVWIQIDSWLA